MRREDFPDNSGMNAIINNLPTTLTELFEERRGLP
jgi:hypothetical protein